MESLKIDEEAKILDPSRSFGDALLRKVGPLEGEQDILIIEWVRGDVTKANYSQTDIGLDRWTGSIALE